MWLWNEPVKNKVNRKKKGKVKSGWWYVCWAFYITIRWFTVISQFFMRSESDCIIELKRWLLGRFEWKFTWLVLFNLKNTLWFRLKFQYKNKMKRMKRLFSNNYHSYIRKLLFLWLMLKWTLIEVEIFKYFPSYQIFLFRFHRYPVITVAGGRMVILLMIFPIKL